MHDVGKEARRLSGLGVRWLRVFVKASMWTDPAYRALVDEYVEKFTARNVYVSLVNMENRPWMTDPDPSNLVAFLEELVTRYAANPGMCGVAVWNEPPKGVLTFDKWRAWARTAAAAIHAASPDALIWIEAGLPNRRGLDPYWRDNPAPTPNVVLYYHDYFWMHYFYNQDAFALSYAAGDFEKALEEMEQTLFDRFFKYAVEDGLCICCDEFGFNGGLSPAGNPGAEPGWPQCQVDYLNLLSKYEIPWNQYSWWVKTVQNYGLAEESDFYTLSPVGKIWRQYLAKGARLDSLGTIMIIGAAYLLSKDSRS